MENLKNANKKSVFLRKMSILSTNECSFIQNCESYPHLSTEKGVKRVRFYAKKEGEKPSFFVSERCGKKRLHPSVPFVKWRLLIFYNACFRIFQADF